MTMLESALLPCLFKDLPPAIRSQYQNAESDVSYVERNEDNVVLRFRRGGAAYWEKENDEMWRLVIGTRAVAS